NKGNDIETDFHRFADTYWHYTDTEDSQGNALDFNYWEWLQAHFRQIGFQDTIDPHNYALIDSLLEETVKNSKSSIYGLSVHTLPSKKTQQYYEMTGKYPQFVYGWEDIDNKALNPTVRDENGNIYYHEGVENIKSPLRNTYEDMRDDSNRELKAGQSGIHLMLINRVLSAIDAARLAYHHNEKIDSELSMVRIRLEQKQIIDHKVPMIVVTKKF
ncbi:MAG TPA: hypothetical protein VMZ04_04200, partial [Anaerolineae bacterium]|nr:hypothetical protein [Anaerolineae bacterium]